MFAWVPILTAILTCIAVRRSVFTGPRFDDFARAALLAATLWGAYLALITEALSLFTALRFGPLLAAWTLPIPALLWWLHRHRRGPEEPHAEESPMAPLALWEAMALAAIVVAVTVTGLIAFFSAPNTWDSMSYHLPRMMHWAQNGSVAHYATHEPRQLYLSPWAEWVATHFHILGGGDRAARLVQWLAMIGGLLAASTIAGQLGAGRGGRILSALAAATIPMGLLQAVSTQTDYVASFHMAVAICFLAGAEKREWPHLWAAALATGLAVLTKGTAYVVLPPFLVVFTWRMFASYRQAAWRPLVLFAAIVIALNLGHTSRNALLFGDPLQPRGLGEYHRYGNGAHGLGVTLSNGIRFAALHLSGPAPDLVEQAYERIRDLHDFLGVTPEDPRTTWPGMRFEAPLEWIHEDLSGNFLHALLILICLVAVAMPQVRQQLPDLARHILLIAASCVLFATLLKWTPWSSRLHLPIFLLAAPAIGTLLARAPRLAAPIVIILIAGAVPFVIRNPLHPVNGLDNVFRRPDREQMFSMRPRLGEFYTQTAERLNATNCRQLGLDMPPDAWEYPLWVALQQASETPARLSVLRAGSVSDRLVDPHFEPCAVLCLSCRPPGLERYRARFGNPMLAVTGDLPHQPDHLLFLE